MRGKGGAAAAARPGSDPAVLGRLGALEARLARSPREIRIAQALRYRVFVSELGARPALAARLLRRDFDRWDACCDHLLVVDRAGPAERIVGTYRFLRQPLAAAAGIGFYTQSEFDIAPLLAAHPDLQFMELGRSCVLPQWRNRRTIELLWHGIWAYVLRHRVDVMLGCASFPGADPDRFAEALAFLYHHAAPQAGWQVAACPGRGVSMDRMAPGAIRRKHALAALPPLVKGYLRLGAWFAAEAVIDRQFATTDVLVILPVSRLDTRYVRYYGSDADRFATPSA